METRLPCPQQVDLDCLCGECRGCYGYHNFQKFS
uniref:Uncharacterized protein n=1 Tax=Rhizophora mucronata TaxID=61149 RepID=A0A2P2QZL6_RHIMU